MKRYFENFSSGFEYTLCASKALTYLVCTLTCFADKLLTNGKPFDRPGVRTFVRSFLLPRKEVIQPHLPIRLPCYDFTPVIGLTLDSWLPKVTSLALGAPNFHGVTGGVYKARERIHRDMLIRDY